METFWYFELQNGETKIIEIIDIKTKIRIL